MLFFTFSFCSQFFFFGSARGFFFQQATTFDSSLKQTREKKEKDFETFLSLFFPLFDTNNTTLALTQRQRRRTRPVLFILLPCVVKFYIERKTVRKEERLILIGLRIIIPRRPRKTQNWTTTKRRLFITHINISLSLSLSIGRYSAECVVLSL